jgi:hypothetical protein
MYLINSRFAKTAAHYLLTILLLSTNISLCLSHEKDSTNFSFIKKSSLEILSKEPSWVALLGGKAKTNKSKQHYARTEDGKDFYLQDNPSHDWLEKEMELSLQKILHHESRDLFLCNYPGRSFWLINKFDLPTEEINFNHCTEMLEWSNQFLDNEFNLAFASSDSSSPASIFGHTFLALHKENGSYLNGYAVNYAANFGHQQNSIAYLAYGVAGGYPGIITVTPLHKKIKEYTYENQRDIFLFKLSLDSKQKKQVIFTLWERKSARFDYFFIDENCSYNILKIIQIVEPNIKAYSNLFNQVIPFETVKSVSNANLISSTSVIYASEKKVRALAKNYSETDQRLLKDLVTQKINYEYWVKTTDKLNEYFALRYVNWSIQKDTIDRKYGRKLRTKLLQANLKKEQDNPNRNFDSIQSYNPDPLLKAHPPNRASLLVNKSNKFNHSLDFNLRWAYHDLLDPVSPSLKNASVEAFSGTFRLDDNNLKLEEFDFISIKSLPNYSLLFPEKSKNFRLSIERTDLTKNKLGLSSTWGRGLSIHANQDDIIYALANLEMTISSNVNNEFAIGYSGELGLNKNLNEKYRLLLTLKNQWFPDEKYNSKTLYLGINYYLSPVVNIGFELNFEENSIKTEGISSMRLNYLF